MASGETREGIGFSHLDAELFDGAGVTKRDLADYLEAVADPLIGCLQERPLSVVRVRPGQPPFMQKNLPTYAPEWLARTTVWAEASRREIAYALVADRRGLLWFANQRAVEYHVTLFRVGAESRPDFLVMDLDPPEGGAFGAVVGTARLVERALADAGLVGAVKTSGSKGLHIFVPLARADPAADPADVAAATRALAARAERLDPELATTEFVRDERGGKVFLDSTRAGGATVVAAYSPRVRPGVPVSFPVAWSDLDAIAPADFTIRNAAGLLAGHDRWADSLPVPQTLPPDLVAEGHAIPIARVQAMHAGKRRARAKRSGEAP